MSMNIRPFSHRMPAIGRAYRQFFLMVIVLLAVFLAGCGQSTPVGLVFNPAPWQDGEEHIFRITDVDGKFAGTMRYAMTAGTNDQGQPMWSITRSTTAQGDQEELTVKVLATGFRPQSSFLERRSAAGRETVDAQYKGPAVDMVLTTRADIATTHRIEAPSDVRESGTLPMITRALPLTRNYATRLNAFLPVVGLLDRVTVRVVGDERLTTPLGAVDAWVVTLDTGNSISRLWIGKDAPHVLLKYIDGRNRATYELERATSPASRWKPADSIKPASGVYVLCIATLASTSHLHLRSVCLRGYLNTSNARRLFGCFAPHNSALRPSPVFRTACAVEHRSSEIRPILGAPFNGAHLALEMQHAFVYACGGLQDIDSGGCV